MKKVIGIDIDSVLADSDQVFTKELERITGKKLFRSDNSPFKYEEAFDLDDKTISKFWQDFTAKRGWQKIPVMPNSVETVKRLKNQDYYIIIISARPPKIEAQTKEWLKINNIYYDELYLTDYKEKINYITHLSNLKYFIEDHPDFAYQFAEKGVKVLLFDWPWNKNVSHKNIIRVKNWIEIQNIFFKSNLNK
ncbi:hypothetical protein J7L48_09250 [bacterium]|nr:hypothetical protein [bacterium]